MRPGGYLRGRKFYGFGCEALEKGDSMITEGRKKEIPGKINDGKITGLVVNADKNLPFGEFPDFG